jgi:hypothetical protein
MRRALFLGWFFLVGLLLGGLSVSAFAANILWSSQDSVVIRAADGSVRAIPGIRELLATVPDGSGGAVTQAAQRVPVGGASVGVQMSKAVPLLKLASAASVAAKLLGPGIVAGLLLDQAIQWVDGQWVEETEIPGWTYTIATNSGLSPQYCENWQIPVTYSGVYPQGAVSFFGSLFRTGPAPMSDGGWTHQNSCPVRNEAFQVVGFVYIGRQVATFSGCPSGQIVGPSGVCQASGTQVMTDAGLASAISDSLVSAPTMAPTILDRTMDAGVLPESDPMSVTGPTSVPGPTTSSTTTGPAGQTTVSTQTTNNLTYNTNVVTVTSSTVTTTTHPDATQTVTTDTTSPPSGGDPVEEPPALCEEFPNASACQELGDPQDEELGEQDQDVSFDSEGGAAGSCPQSIPFFASGTSQSLSWQPTCDFASGIRPFVIGIAWLSAGLFVFAVASRKS